MSSEFINNYEFGRIVIENKSYTDDLILLGRNVKPKWWRKSGHSLDKKDLEKILDYKPDLLIIGTGTYGMMKISSKLSKKLNFKIIAYPTKEAVKKYNQEIKGEKKIAGAFHLTC
ncbi:MAG: Mth938-like domain-containing protein [Promethearchaeota archaeon]